MDPSTSKDSHPGTQPVVPPMVAEKTNSVPLNVAELLQQVAENMKSDTVEKVLHGMQGNMAGSSGSEKENLQLVAQFTIINQLMTMNTCLSELRNKGDDIQRARIEASREAKKTESDEAKSNIASLSFEVIGSGGIIAVFLAGLDAALLALANDVYSGAASENGLPFIAKFSISCWTFSLIVSLFIVLVGSVITFLHLWETLAGHVHKFAGNYKMPTPFGTLDKTLKKRLEEEPHQPLADEAGSVFTDSRDDVRQYDVFTHTFVHLFLSIIAAIFNVLVAPALFATILGTTLFAWDTQPRLSSISTIVTDVLLFLLIAFACAVLAAMRYVQAEALDKIYKSWAEEREKDKKNESKVALVQGEARAEQTADTVEQPHDQRRSSSSSR